MKIDLRQRRVALLVAGCMFMELLDGTIVTTSAPRIAHALAVPTTRISLVITAYLVTLASLIALGGWISARFGSRKVFLVAIAVFTVASLGCALSTNLNELVGMRVLQAIGGAMMVPVGRFVVFYRAEKSQLMRITAYIVWPGLMAPVIAPLAGGLITTYLSWHWLFLINVPLGVIALTIAARIIESPDQGAPPRLDVSGVLLTCVSLAALTITAELLSQPTPNWPRDIGATVAAVALMFVGIRHLLHAENPLIDLRTLRIHTFQAGISGSFIYLTVVAAAPFLAPLMFEEVFGWSAVKSGALVLFIFVGNVGIKPATTFLYTRFGFRTVLITSTTIMSATMIAMGFVTARTPIVLIAAIMLLSGVVRSVGLTGYTTVVFSDVPTTEMRHATTLQSTSQQLAAGLGVAGGAVALRVGHPIGRLLSSHPNAAAPYTVAFILVALISLIATTGAVRLRRDAGDMLRHRGDTAPEPAGAREPAIAKG